MADFYPQDVISEVKALNDIVDVVGGYVKLSARAGNHFGICPFHNEKTPSFSVNKDKQIFYCFGCGAGGNVISFIKRIENMDFPDALKLLADRVHFNLPEKGTSPQAKIQAAERETAAKLNKIAARFYHENLYAENTAAIQARKYLEERGVKPALARRFGLGLSPDGWTGILTAFPEIAPKDFETAGLVKSKDARFYDRFRNRLMFPIIDTRSRVIGFGGRVMGDDDGAKYLNSPETALFKKSECLYGLNLAKKARAQEIIVVEGYMDVLTMHQHGFSNTVGVLGTAMRGSHARLIKNAGAHTVILILDSDEAGIRAALRAIPVLIKEEIKVKILQLPDAKDPDEYLSRFGAAKFSVLLKEAKSHISFQVGLERGKFDLETTDGRVGFTKECAKILATLTSAIETDAYVGEISKATSISATAIHKEIEKITGENRAKSEFSYSPRRVVQKKAGEDAGLKNAKKGLLYLLFTEPEALAALKRTDISVKEEMGEDGFSKLLDFALTNAVNAPSDVFDFFHSDSDQQLIAEIFAETKEYPTKAAVEKALNDMVKKIKLSWLNSRMENEKSDLNAVKSIHLQIKSINSLNISLHDG
ncbi:MAG: DNA primase [Defluviitaleaceae bacterium]|nr:DNA primase [Defluviitaleaceae bacterium]MCL2263036.1 DNA primase [Defluviitaleaceae bacterium]